MLKELFTFALKVVVFFVMVIGCADVAVKFDFVPPPPQSWANLVHEASGVLDNANGVADKVKTVASIAKPPMPPIPPMPGGGGKGGGFGGLRIPTPPLLPRF